MIVPGRPAKRIALAGSLPRIILPAGIKLVGMLAVDVVEDGMLSRMILEVDEGGPGTLVSVVPIVVVTTGTT